MNYYDKWFKAVPTNINDVVQSPTVRLYSYMVVIRVGDPAVPKTSFVRALSKLDAADGAIKALGLSTDEVKDVFVIDSISIDALR